ELLDLIQNLLAPLDHVVQDRPQGQRSVDLDDVHAIQTTAPRIRHPAGQPDRFGIDALPSNRHQDLLGCRRVRMIGHQCCGPRRTRLINTYAPKATEITAVTTATPLENASRPGWPAR